MAWDCGFFRKNVAFLMSQSGKTYAELSNELGINPSSVSRMFNQNRTCPTLDQIVVICKYFDESIDDMINIDIEDWEKERKIHSANMNEKFGRQTFASRSVYMRYEDTTYYIYYLTGQSSFKLRTGELNILKTYEKGGYINGELKLQNGNTYKCKVVIDHPAYLYIYCINDNDVERLLIVLQEKRYSNKKYLGGIGAALWEGSNYRPTFQKMIVSKYEIKLNSDSIEDKIVSLLSVQSSSSFHLFISEKDENEIYGIFKNLAEETKESF